MVFLGVILVGLLLLGSQDLGVGVEGIEELSVSQGVLLLSVVENDGGLSSSDLLLNLVRVDDSSEIRVGDHGSEELVSVLLEGGVSVGSEELVKGSEGALSPDDESSELTTRSKLEEVESVDIDDFDSGDVSECLDEFGVFIKVNDKGSLSDSVSLSSDFSDTRSDAF